ncbi:MAG: hypothetical protein JWN63_2570, partial [Candidatus Acidoferrum typicum]|nr:hypothetical protein [Candidatus Acidoferrum typicum]
MPEDLKIKVVADISGLSALAGASEQVASSVSSMAERFVKSGLSAEQAASALRNMGVSAKEAASATAAFGVNVAAAASKTVAATNAVDGMTRAMAASGVRIAASELGLGQLGFAFSRVGSASSALAPILSAAFPVFGAIALVDLLDHMYDKLREVSLESLHNAETWETIDHSGNVAFENLDRSIERADEKIVELSQGKLAGLELALKHVGDGAVQMASHIETLFTAIGGQLEKEQTLFDKAKDFYDFFAGHGLVIPNQGELAKLFGADLSKTLDTAGLAAGIAKVSAQIAIVNKELLATPKDKQLSEYADQLIRVLGLLEERRTLEDKEKGVKRAEIGKEEEAEGRRQILAELNDAERAAKEKMKIAEEAAKFNRTAIAAIEKEGADNYVTVWREGIRQQATDFEKGQKDMAAAMQAVKQSSALETAGIGPGPISNVLRAKGIAEESAVARAAYNEAESAARNYGAELLKLA